MLNAYANGIMKSTRYTWCFQQKIFFHVIFLLLIFKTRKLKQALLSGKDGEGNQYLQGAT